MFMGNRAALLSVLFAAVFCNEARAREPESIQGARVGGFVDTYFAYDFRRPQSHDRPFTTQAARDNEFNVNLAFIELTLEQEEVRGRLALQAGSSVQANYSSEPRIGSVSGPDLSRHVQEAFAGFRATEKTCIDAGIFFSHIGFESFISNRNWTYSRSLVSDFSPYYQSGVRLSHQITEAFSAQLHVINGWQNVSESNSQKALGAQLDYRPNRSWGATYNSFVGAESGNRIFHDLILKWFSGAGIETALSLDLGNQDVPRNDTRNTWLGASALVRFKASEKIALCARVERYSDPGRVIVTPSNGVPFNVSGASLGLDVEPQPRLLWRAEVRGFTAEHPVFPDGEGFSRQGGSLVSSLSLGF